MAEYIEREALMKKISADGNPDNLPDGYIATPNDVYVFAIAAVETFPAADVAPVAHGRWVQVICHVEFEDGFVDRLYESCSRCHKPNGRKTSDYCPNCGARMDGE